VLCLKTCQNALLLAVADGWMALGWVRAGNATSIRNEFDLGGDANGSLSLCPVISDGTVRGVLGLYGA